MMNEPARKRSKREEVLWPVDGFKKLMIGSDAAVAQLRDLGITHVFNCSSTLRDWAPPEDVAYFDAEVVDRSEFSLEHVFSAGLKWLRRALLESQGNVLVFCSTGLRVCPAVVIAYRMIYGGKQFHHASTLHMDINDGFYRQLIRLEGLLQERGAMFVQEFTEDADEALLEKETAHHAENPLLDYESVPAERAHLTLVKRDVKLSDLIERGLIKLGSEIVYKQRRNIVHRGTIINRFGMISYNGTTYDSPSLFVTSLLHTHGGSQRTKRNGWTAAQVNDRTLESYRTELLQRQHKAEDSDT